jgi:two-component system OmpR family response regulator
MMPGLDGFGVVRRLRQNGTHTPVVFLTARTQHDDRAAGVSAGADAYLTKPFSPRGLAETVKQLLGF